MPAPRAITGNQLQHAGRRCASEPRVIGQDGPPPDLQPCSIAVPHVLLRASRWPTAQAGAERAPGSGSVVTWRRVQMVLLSAQGMDAAAIAKVAFTSEGRVGLLRMPPYLETAPLDSLALDAQKWRKRLGGRDRGRPGPAGQLLPRANAHEPSPVERLVLLRAEVRRPAGSTGIWSSGITSSAPRLGG